MRGDVAIVDEHQRGAAERIATRRAAEIAGRARRTIFTVAGETGGGKSETAATTGGRR